MTNYPKGTKVVGRFGNQGGCVFKQGLKRQVRTTGRQKGPFLECSEGDDIKELLGLYATFLEGRRSLHRIDKDKKIRRYT